MSNIEWIVGVGTVIVAVLTYLVSYVKLDDGKRSEFKQMTWVVFESVWAVFSTGLAAYVLFSFWAKSTSPTRGEIILAIFYSLILLWGPKSIAEGFLERRLAAHRKVKDDEFKAYLEKNGTK